MNSHEVSGRNSASLDDDATTQVNQVVTAIGRVASAPCALHEPTLSGNAEAFVSDCIRSGWVSSVGAYVDRFERDLANYTGARYCIATVNGTAAIHIALLMANVCPGDEVLVPSLSFVATANAVQNCSAIPHFIDVDDTTMGMAPVALEQRLFDIAERTNGSVFNKVTGCRIAAIMPMHAFGHPCEIESLVEIADRYQIPVVEDAAESLGSWYRGKHTGTFGQVGAVSFNGNKIITTGGGGAILTDSESIAKQAKHITTTAKIPHAWLYEHDQHAFNYRMPNLNAALGCAQLEMLPEFLATKRNIAKAYQSEFARLPFAKFCNEPTDSTSNYWLNSIRFTGQSESFRDLVLKATNQAELMTRPCWTPLNRLPMYSNCPSGELPVTNQIFTELINVPSGCGIRQPNQNSQTNR